MPKDILTKTLEARAARADREWDAWIEGRFIYYVPTFPLMEVKEWWGRYDKKREAYKLPALTLIARKIQQHDPQARMSSDVEYLLSDWEEHDKIHPWQHGSWHPGYARLYGFQKTAVDALVSRPYHGCLLTLSPGLGKTPTSIVAAEHWCAEYGDSNRILVVSPLSLTHNWVREINDWAVDTRVERCHQIEPTPNKSVKWTVTNYDSLIERGERGKATNNVKEDWLFDWDIIIYDESVLLKNRKTTRGIVANKLAEHAKRVWLLSGAPVTRDYSDIWNQLHVIEPHYFGSFWSFAKEYCVVVKSPWSDFTIEGSRHDKNLRTDFPELMFVRNQEEVFEELPEYIHQEITLPLSSKQKKAHDDILSEWIHQLEENADRYVEMSAFIAVLTRLQQVTSNLYNLQTAGRGDWPDSSTKADFVEEFLDIGDLDWPVLIWVHHRPGAHALYGRLTKVLKDRRVELVLGKTKNADSIIEDFKAGKVDVLLLGITVGKYGHTLANAHTIITYDKVWDSDAWFQMLHRAAGARAKLAGYTHRPLLINPRCQGTVDDFVELNLAGKLPSMANVTGADLAKILRSLGEEHVK